MTDNLRSRTSDQASEWERPPNPLDEASWFSKLMFLWPNGLLKIGRQRPLTDRDLGVCCDQDTSTYNLRILERLWKAEQKRCPEKPSLRRALFINFLKSTWKVQPFMAMSATAKIVQAVALGSLVEALESEQAEDGYTWAAVIIGSGLVILFEHHHVFLATWRHGMRLRISCVAAIYSKSLRLSSTHQESSASYGKIMNLASNDVERFLLASLFLSYFWWSLIQGLAILVVGVWLVGPAFAAGFGLLIVIFLPLQMYLSHRFALYRSRIAKLTDQRVSFVGQAVRGARVMKMSGYEDKFLDRIQDLRHQEVSQIRKANGLKAYNEALFFCTNVVISVTIFVVHVLIGGTLRAGDVFSVFTLINVLQLEMIKHVSLAVMGVSECSVSIGRIQEFLEFPELPGVSSLISDSEGKNKKLESKTQEHSSLTEEGVAVQLENTSCYWNKVSLSVSTTSTDSDTDSLSGRSLLPAIENASVAFHYGELTAVIGTVGSGKSALLQAVVGELPVSEGTLARRPGSSLSYAAQDPWIMDGSVKDNIVMASTADEDWYLTVVSACGLLPDFQQFRDGDRTVVGDRGVQCSGGQRARIGLARAIYRDADILVADDPLSAVDAKVGRQLFEDAIVGLAVKRGKCVILATHQHQYINDHRCILVTSGIIGCIGSYADCVEASHGKLTAHSAHDTVDTLGQSKENTTLKTDVDDSDALEENDLVNEQAETNHQGVVQRSTYLAYMKAMGSTWIALWLFLLFTATQGSVLVTITSLGRWAERPEEDQKSSSVTAFVVGLSTVVVVLALIRAFIMYHFTMKASQRLHDKMTKAVLRAKIEFFDTNPLGRILNRFSADVGSSDDLLPSTLFDFLVIAFMILGAFITTVVTLPFTLLAFPPLLIYFYRVRSTFVTSSRELKRLEGLARSPIFAKLSESLSGIASIRANDAVNLFVERFEEVHNAHTRAFFAFMASSRWVGFRMDAIVFFFLSMVCLLAVLFQSQGWVKVDAAVLGLSLSMLLQLAGLFQWCIRQSAEVVNQMVSVERVLDFGRLPPEAPLEVDQDDAVVQSGWPAKGNIEFDNLSVRYRATLPLALEKVKCSIPASSRVGIVGRTGSGKSTIVQTLFRLLEADQGRITIDGVDISALGLHTLRPKISVIPQIPTLFSGCTVRENLDLFGLHTDESIRKVLQDCHLTSVVDALPAGWNSIVSEGGSNFSVGQRQLLCLARALLSKNRILVLDEATASVDRRTDQLLHEALHRSFSDGTILAVAHRLDTIIEYDLILVLGQGKVLEFGSPAELIRSDGAFASMVRDTGDTMSRELQRRALQNETE